MNDDPSLIRRRGQGFAAEGPGFYVWDENMNEVLSVVAVLRAETHRVRPAQRVLRVRSDGRPDPHPDSEALDA
jgi:hypothetical protein